MEIPKLFLVQPTFIKMSVFLYEGKILLELKNGPKLVWLESDLELNIRDSSFCPEMTQAKFMCSSSLKF